ncbi:MAG: elongation factor P [Candidatus Aenigmatarchaeota archaeon]
MISTSDFRKGMKITVDGEIYYIVDFQHSKTAQRKAVVRTKLKNIKTGALIEKTFFAGETFEEPDFEERFMVYLYSNEDGYTFMDSKTYEQVTIPEEYLGEAKGYIKENEEYKILFFEGKPVSIDLPSAVILKVISTEPAIRGDSITNIMKPATLETGLTVKVPLFIKEGDLIKVDTRTGEYLERAS